MQDLGKMKKSNIWYVVIAIMFALTIRDFWVNQSRIKRAETIIENHFTEAIERIVAGLEKKNRLINPFERIVEAQL